MLRRCLTRRFIGNMAARPTPNPDCIQFRPLPPLEGVLPPSCPPCDIPYRSLSGLHPLAAVIFEHYEKEVRSVFLSEDYVAVTKWSDIRWGIELERSICSLIGSFLMTHDCIPPARSSDVDGADDSFKVNEQTDSEVMQMVKELLRKEVRPMVQRDGGDIRLMDFDETAGGVVKLKMLGACRSCPSSQNTLKDGIERLLRHYVPEVKEVVEYKTETDKVLDDMSRQRELEAEKKKKKQQQQQNGEEVEDDDDTEDSAESKEKEKKIAVSFGAGQTITATAGWNRSSMMPDKATLAKMAEEQKKHQERESSELEQSIRTQLESVGATPSTMTAEERDVMRSQGFIPGTRLDRDSERERRRQSITDAAFGGLTEDDRVAALRREQELEKLLRQEAEQKQKKLAQMRAQRQRLRRETGFDEPEG